MAEPNRINKMTPKAPTLGFIVESNTADTLRNCESIARFIGNRVNEAGGRGIELGDDDRDAVFRIMHTIADVLRYESERVEGARS